MLKENIDAGRYHYFSFIITKLNDSIKILLPNEAKNNYTRQLISIHKFILDSVVNKKSTFSSYEKSWYFNQTFAWFNLLYFNSAKSSKEIAFLEDELIHILRYYIDHDLIEIFEKFLSSSSQTYSYLHFDKQELERILKNAKTTSSVNVRSLTSVFVNELTRKKSDVFTLNQLKKQEELINKRVDQMLEKRQLELDNKVEIYAVAKSIYLSHFKIAHFQTVLLQAISYSLSKGSAKYLLKLESYFKPSESKSIHIGTDHGNFTKEIIFNILVNIEEIENEFRMIYSGQHSYEIYLNTILGYWLMKFEISEFKSYLTKIKSTDQLRLLKFKVEEIYKSNQLDKFTEELKLKYSIGYFTSRIQVFINILDEAVEILESQNILSSEIDPAIALEIISSIIREYDSNTNIRLIYKTLNLIRENNEPNDQESIGINQLVPKKLFLKENDSLFIGFAQSYGDGLATFEDRSIIDKIRTNCKPLDLTKSEFKEFLKTNTEYDIIISLNPMDLSIDLDNFNLQYQPLNHQFNNINNFVGVLENRYSYFSMAISDDDNYILLNSKNLGNLIQNQPPAFEAAQRVQYFNYSIIDFKNNPEAIKRHIKEFTEKELLTNVWLRIYESFEISLPKKENGLSIKIPLT